MTIRFLGRYIPINNYTYDNHYKQIPIILNNMQCGITNSICSLEIQIGQEPIIVVNNCQTPKYL